MGGGGGKKGGGQKVHLYLAGVQTVCCYGPVDAVTELRFGQRTGWAGRITGTQSIFINQPNLFGGNKQEGGVVGQVDIEFGDPTQPQNPYLQSRVLSAQVASYDPSFWGPLEIGPVTSSSGAAASIFGSSGTSSDNFQPIEVPANRGVLGLIFRQFQWAANNPYMKALAVRIERVLAGWDGGAWYPSKAVIPLVTQEVITSITDTNGTSTTYSPVGTAPTSTSSVTSGTVTTTTGTFGYNHMNPAHIIYECLTNRVWGMGWPRTMIDDVAFQAAADALYTEGFGISIEWKSQESMDTFIGNLLQHINASLFIDLTTGLFRLVLVRMDYDPTTLIVLDESNILGLDEYQRKAWGETINELVVNYTDVVDGLTKSVSVQDLANIRAQGARITQTHNYLGLPTADLAYRVAVRDLQALSAPLATVQLRVNRTGVQLIPGGVFKLSWSALGLRGVIFRIGEIDYGTLTDGAITITAIEDVFGMPSSTYSLPPVAWTEQSNAPLPASVARYVEAPYWAVIQKYQGYQISQFDPNFGIGMTLAARPSGATLDYDLNYSSAANGPYTTGSSLNAFTPAAQIEAAMVPEATSTFSYLDGPDWDSAQVGQVVFVDDEAMQLTALDTVNKTASVARGCLDSIPVSHVAGSVVWAPGTLYAGFDDVSRVTGETTYYRLTPRNSIGTLDIAKAPTGSVTFNDRYQRPYAPGNFKLNGAYWPQAILGALSLSWAHRDRVLQDNQIVPFSSGNIGPETGTTYRCRIYNEDGTLVHDDSTLVGTSYSYTTEDVDLGKFVYAPSGVPFSVVVAVDPYESYYAAELRFEDGNLSTAFTDPYGNTWTPLGGAVESTTNPLYGAGSLTLNGSTQYLQVSNPSKFNTVAGQVMTIEMSVKPTVNPYGCALITAQFTGTGDSVAFTVAFAGSGDMGAGGNYPLFGFYNGSTWTAVFGTTPFVAGTKYDLMAVADGTYLYLFVNGNLEGKVAASIPARTCNNIWIGRRWDNTFTPFFNGTIDEFRIIWGAAKQTSSYSVLNPPLTAGASAAQKRLNGNMRIRLLSHRDTYDSISEYDGVIDRAGYGYSYGKYYGGV